MNTPQISQGMQTDVRAAPTERVVRASEVIEFVESLAPPSRGVTADRIGVVFGSVELLVSAVGVCWSPTLYVLEEAARRDVNLIITHEILFFYRKPTEWLVAPRTESKTCNLRRMRILLECNMCVYRAHSNWDIVPEVGNCDAFAGALGLVNEIAQSRFGRVHVIEPVTLEQLVKHVKHRMRLECVRVLGDPTQLVSRIGTACGGLGQMYEFPEEMANLGAEVVIFGEALDYTFRHAAELRLAVIETAHMTSEKYGLIYQANMLQERFPQLPVHYLDCDIPWTWR